MVTADSSFFDRAAAIDSRSPDRVGFMASAPPVVAILNTNDDIVEILRFGIERAGLIAVSAHVDDIRRGHANLEDFIREHEPAVIIFDVAPPYDSSWRYLARLRELPLMAGRQWVITSTNVARARELGGADKDVFEIVGKPYDIDKLVDVVREAARARPVHD